MEQNQQPCELKVVARLAVDQITSLKSQVQSVRILLPFQAKISSNEVHTQYLMGPRPAISNREIGTLRRKRVKSEAQYPAPMLQHPMEVRLKPVFMYDRARGKVPAHLEILRAT